MSTALSEGAIHEPVEPTRDAREAAVLPTERLEAEITELAGHLAAAECRWLLLVAEYDRRAAWKQWGCASLVHWLGWQCGLDPRSARERVRVARALLVFGVIRDAFASGALSYSKVRAITRIATPESEVGLVSMARNATAAQIERIVAAYRRVFDPDRLAGANRAHASRGVQCSNEDDGFSARLHTTHDDGARFRGALDQVVECSLRERPLAEGETRAQRRADVLVDAVVAAADGRSTARPGPPADRHLVVVTVDASVLAEETGDVCELDGGPGLPAETARRLACDAEIVGLVRGADATITGIGRAERRPPRWLRRRLHARDRGCRFPGCGERRHVRAHHVRHWARGGPTDLANLVELCPYHHRLVHEGGWTLTVDGVSAVTFTAPDGRVITDTPDRSGSAEPPHPIEPFEAGNARRGVAIDPDTIQPDSYDPLDLDLAITALTPPGRGDPYRRR